MSTTRGKGLSLEEFMGHDTRSGGGQFLRGWRKRQPPAVNTWLHTRAPIVALWQHQWPRLHVFEDRESGQTRKEIWGGSWNCLEHEDVLKRQYRRDENDEREAPPIVCPLCRLIETVRLMVRDGQLKITQPIFKYEVDGDDEHARILTAGGIYNAFGDEKKLTEEQVALMKRARIRPSEAWKENSYAKCNYLFCVVDNEHPEGGTQIAIETTLLGDKVKGVIRDQMTSLGEDDGHPLKKPYCIRWEHRPAEKEFSKRYHALAMPKIKLSDEVRRIIVDEAPPDVSRIIAPGNVRTLRANLERFALVKLPWDDIFGPAEALSDESGNVEDLDFGDAEDEPAPTPPQQASRPSNPKPAAAPAKEPEPEVEMVACDDCKKPMRIDAAKCPSCGAEYELDKAPPPPPPPTKTRSQAKSKAAPPPPPPPPPQPADDDGDEF